MCFVVYIAAFVNIMILWLRMSSCLRPWHPLYRRWHVVMYVGMIFDILLLVWHVYMSWTVSFEDGDIPHMYVSLCILLFVSCVVCMSYFLLPWWSPFPLFKFCVSWYVYDCIASFMIFRLILFFHEYICFVLMLTHHDSLISALFDLLTILYWWLWLCLMTYLCMWMNACSSVSFGIHCFVIRL